MSEIIGKVLGWAMVIGAIALMAWLVIGFIGFDWNLHSWGPQLRAVMVVLIAAGAGANAVRIWRS